MPLDLKGGCYDLSIGVASDRVEGANNWVQDELQIEIRSELEILAIETWAIEPRPGFDQVLTFEVPNDPTASSQIALTIRAAAPVEVHINGVRIKRRSDEETSSPLLLTLQGRVRDNVFHLGAAARVADRGLMARDGFAGTIGYIRFPYCVGRYEAILAVKRVGLSGHPRGQVTITAGKHVLASRDFDFSARRVGLASFPRGPLRICSFEEPVELMHEASTMQIRVNSIGRAPFVLSSITVAPKTRLRLMRDQVHVFAIRMLKWMSDLLGGLKTR